MASFDFADRSGTGFRSSVMRRSVDGDFARLARSIDRAFAVGSFGFCKCTNQLKILN